MGEQRVALIILFVGIAFVIGVVYSRAIDEKESEKPIETPGLYNSSDRVVVLNVTSFKNNVYSGEKAWLVEFYNSWCGYCQRFAPVWKSLANSIYGWRDIIAVAAIDCANDDNTPLCRDYEIMGYPTIKFYPASNNKDFLGKEMKKNDDINRMIESLVETMIDEQFKQSRGLSWPNMDLYRGAEPNSLFQIAGNKTQYVILIFEEPESHVGAEVILDLHKLNSIIIRRVKPFEIKRIGSANLNPSVISEIKKFPSVIVVDKNLPPKDLDIDSGTREGIKNSIVKFLKSKNIPADIIDETSDEPKVDHVNKLNTQSHNVPKKTNHQEDQLYRLDLESTLHMALNNEIPRMKIITGENLEALQTFLKVIALYFPGHTPKTKHYLHELKEYVESKNNITGKEFKEYVRLKEKEFEPVFSGTKTFIGCEGSSPEYRRYPCGLWTTFHTLTVAAAEFSYVNDHDHPPVLTAMHGYIKNFFGCADCANHFQLMAKERNIFESRTADDNILWLWKAHNVVNDRLAGDDTEDPEHKKIQYPSAENCPKCRLLNGNWDENEVLNYLKSKYNKFNIIEGDKKQESHHHNDNNGLTSSASTHKLNWDFTIFDISICVVLYATSAMILILVFIKFAFKRTSRKKPSFSNLSYVKVKH